MDLQAQYDLLLLRNLVLTLENESLRERATGDVETALLKLAGCDVDVRIAFSGRWHVHGFGTEDHNRQFSVRVSTKTLLGGLENLLVIYQEWAEDADT